MVISSKVTSEPSEEPVTLTEAKVPLKVTGTSEDTYITTLIKVARLWAERYSGRSFITQTRTIKLDYFPSCNAPIVIPYGPVISLSTVGLGVSYLNDDDVTTTLTFDTDYKLDSHSEPNRIYPVDDWPTDYKTDHLQAITITYTAGYGAAAAVPDLIKEAIKKRVMDLYEGTDHYTRQAEELLDTVKVYWNAHQD